LVRNALDGHINCADVQTSKFKLFMFAGQIKCKDRLKKFHKIYQVIKFKSFACWQIVLLICWNSQRTLRCLFFPTQCNQRNCPNLLRENCVGFSPFSNSPTFWS